MIALGLGEVGQLTGGRLVDGATSEAVVTGPVVIDSRRATPGSLFVCVAGEHTDGHHFAAAAAEAGAVAALAARPVGVPASYADHARLMFDLQLLAMQGDVTRVITFQLARETSNRSYPEIGVSDPHHPLSHHGNDPAKIAIRSRC